MSKLTVVRDHHGYWPKQRLEVVGKLRTTSVAGVHRNERCAGRHQLDFTAFEHESL